MPGFSRAIVTTWACAYTRGVNGSWLRNNAPRRALFAAVAAFALIAAQSIVVGHEIGGDGHTPDSVCEFCIAGASLTDSNLYSVKIVPPVTVSIRVPDSGADRARTNTFPRSRYARAPPSAS